ncbi:uncharacterized protein LOC105211857 [Zeugodacus cucurbitae]|uniref:uncharacterized protein LOC105211857 n=1 Tax=Zeugodacus cucurbitae TaxID=28588 RepID=UPI0023D92688|nr:uncharacterized protein LOC105211857 [Zeugodacus cucurbitae]
MQQSKVMHFCRICRTEKNLKYTVKELRKCSQKRCNDNLLYTTPTLGNICHDCEERLHNFHRLNENEDNEERIIVDDDELLYNLFFEKVEQHRLMKRLMVVGAGGGGGEWNTTSLRQQTLVAATAGVAVNIGDEVIEVLTSRENTPSPALPISSTPAGAVHPAGKKRTIVSPKKEITATITRNEKDSVNITATENTTSTRNTATTKSITSNLTDKCTPYKVLAVIDLDDDEDLQADKVPVLPTPEKTPDTDEEEIVFRKVELANDKDTRKDERRGNQKSRKGKYQHGQMNLIASLSLVSSDSESDVQVTDSEISPIKRNDTTITDNNNTTQFSPPLGCINNIKAVSPPILLENMQRQECFEAAVKCPVCQTEFTDSQRLIHHMRRKHRSYNGQVLSERPRCAQDSAMTIRLRYMQRYMYYECQLCGCIDAVFKIHKEHVMQKHAEESKSLKDPMMQTLKCPVCKEKCGSQHTELLRHMLHAHKATECREHFRQITKFRNLFPNCGAKKEKELKHTARIYQITSRKQYFFECIECLKIVTGYFNYVKHQNTHIKLVHTKSTETLVSETDSTTTARSSTEPELKRVKPICAETKAKFEKPKPLLTSKELNAKRKVSVPQQIVAQKSTQPQPRRERKLTKKAVQAALVKVKVKPPLKQLPAQRYKCNYCVQQFKGFHRLNLHLLRVHAFYDGHLRCGICMLRFVSNKECEEHERNRHHCKQMRKIVTNSLPETNETSQEDDTAINAKRQRLNSESSKIEFESKIEISKPENTTDVTNATWLQELLSLAVKKQTQNSNTANNSKSYDNAITGCTNPKVSQEKRVIDRKNEINEYAMATTSHQCLYCSHLFSSLSKLQSHEIEHVQQRDVKIFQRRVIGVISELQTHEIKQVQQHQVKMYKRRAISHVISTTVAR